jgi:DNA polymerase III subunit delta'
VSDTPLTLSRVAGQERVVETLRALVLDDGPVPPLLFHGPDGVGKRTTALALAASLVCRERDGTDACGACLACRRVAAAGAVTALREKATSQDHPVAYPDVGYVSIPAGRTRISVLQARDVSISLSSRPYEMSRRIYVVDPADGMTTEAANAMLKILEEPPSYGVLILVTSAPWALPVTVRSRMRPVPFRRLSNETIREHLLAAGVSAAEADLRVMVGDGSLGRALGSDAEAAASSRDAWVEILRRLAASDAAGPLAVGAAQAFAASAAESASAIGTLLAVLRDVAAVASGASPRLLPTADAAELAADCDRLLGPAHERPELVERLRADLRTFNLNPRLVVEGSVLALGGRLRERDLPPRP